MKKKFYASLLASFMFLNTVAPAVAKANQTETTTNKEMSKEDITKARKDDINTLIKTLEEKHPNIYNKNSKEIFDKKILEIEKNIATISDFDFAIELSELTALVGDSHTAVAIGNILGDNVHYLPINLGIVKEGLLVTGIPKEHERLLGGILVSINGASIDEIKEKLKPMIGYDNEIYLDRQFNNIFYIYEILKHYNIVDSLENISLGIKIGDKIEEIKVNAVDSATMETMDLATAKIKDYKTKRNKSKIYFFDELNDETVYIQYNSCREDKNLPMKTFTEQVKNSLEKNGYKKVIIDLRNNGGGSDGVIRPLMNMLEEKIKQDGINLYTIIGSKTFSSALINAVMLKEIGSTIVGTPTGGSVDHFGSVSSFRLPNSKIGVQYSNKFFDLSTLLKSAEPYNVEPFNPDILVEKTSKDYLEGIDTPVEKILKDDKKAMPRDYVTREDLSVVLGRYYLERTKDEFDLPEIKFKDISVISYAYPYIQWAKANNIMVGENEEQFLPNREITKGELAVVLTRYADLLKISLKDLDVKNNNIKDIDLAKAWQKEAIKTLAGTNIFPLDNNMFKPNDKVSKKDFENIFKQFKSLIK